MTGGDHQTLVTYHIKMVETLSDNTFRLDDPPKMFLHKKNPSASRYILAVDIVV